MFPKKMGELSGLLREAMALKAKVEELKGSLGDETVEASAGGGMVQVVMTGEFEVVSLKIDPEVINKDDPEMLETLIRAAINEGVRKIRDLVRSKITELTGGIELPGLL